MPTLMLIADDLTGTFDASVPFVAAGVSAVTSFDPKTQLADTLDQTKSPVLAINADSRHLDSYDAFLRVGFLVDAAHRAGCRVIFKKTDSVLRGNIGAELAAMWGNAGRGCLHFLPAWPSMGRVTRDGVHYVDGQPVAETRFGKDPFDPVKTSRIQELLTTRENVPTLHVGKDDPVPVGFSGIAYYDAETSEDLQRRSEQIARQTEGTILLAGCGGLAHAFANTLGLGGLRKPESSVDPSRILVLFGSVNPVSQGQLAYAEEQGAPTFHVSEPQKLDPAFVTSEAGAALCRDAAKSWDVAPITVVNATSFIPKDGPVSNETRSTISRNIGALLHAIVEDRKSGTIAVAGGDVLQSFLNTVPFPHVRLLGEVIPGVVDTEVTCGDRVYRILTKSGGFGEKDLIVQLAHKLQG